MAQRIALSDTVSVTLPNGAEKINRDQFSTYLKNKFKNSQTALPGKLYPSERTDNKHFFKVDNILVSFVHGKRPAKNKDNYLLAQKQGFDA